MEFYWDLIDVSHIQKFYGSELLIINGCLRNGLQRRDLTFGGGAVD